MVAKIRVEEKLQPLPPRCGIRHPDPKTMSHSAVANASPVAVIGGGHMARSLVAGLRARGWPAAAIAVSEPRAEARADLARDFGIATHADNLAAARGATTWVLAVKPQSLPEVCVPLAALAQASRPLVVSIAAGVSTAQLARWLGPNLAIVRCMPNLPASIGAGATGMVGNAHVDAAAAAQAVALLGALGTTAWIDDEARMDAVTGVSGTGPAYLFLLAEAMQAAAQAEGLDAPTSRALIAQTLLGAARLLAESGEQPAELRRRVTSPGGTTEAAMAVFDAGGFVPLVGQAIAAATRRGGELSAALQLPVAAA
jgi:pyrroline-5-carboxylate reductase